MEIKLERKKTTARNVHNFKYINGIKVLAILGFSLGFTKVVVFSSV